MRFESCMEVALAVVASHDPSGDLIVVGKTSLKVFFRVVVREDVEAERVKKRQRLERRQRREERREARERMRAIEKLIRDARNSRSRRLNLSLTT